MKRPNRFLSVWAFSYAYIRFTCARVVFRGKLPIMGDRIAQEHKKTAGKERRIVNQNAETSKYYLFFFVFRFFFPFPFPFPFWITIHARSASNNYWLARIRA